MKWIESFVGVEVKSGFEKSVKVGCWLNESDAVRAVYC